MTYYGTEGMASRRQKIAELTCAFAKPHFAPDGSWIGPEVDQGMREYAWFAIAFLQEGSSENVKLANNIIRCHLPGYRFCHFLPFILLQIFQRFSEKVEWETEVMMDEYLHEHVPEFMSPGLDFVGANDNFPCLATGTVLLAGMRYERLEYIERVRERLVQFTRQLERRGFPAEYNSPTYSSIQALGLADIAEFAEDGNIRQLAFALEARVWEDLLAHMHWPNAQEAGPYSRAYPIDAAGCTHQSRNAYYMIYGDELAITPMETTFHSAGCASGMIIHHDPDFLRISVMWQALSNYHCPAELAEWAKNKQYPFICAGTSESINATERPDEALSKPVYPMPDYYELPPANNHLYTYMTEEYAIGSSRYYFHDGNQSHALHVLYRKRPVKAHSDVGTAFFRYAVNDHEIGWGDSAYFDLGRKLAVQKENTAMILYTPKPVNNAGIYKLHLTANITALYELPDEVYIEDRKLSECTGEGNADERVFVKDGDVYMMFKPLLLDKLNGGPAIRVSAKNRVLEISFVNYEGEARDFTPSELLKIGNGAIVCVKDKQQAGSFEAFRESFSPRISDEWRHTSRKTRYEDGNTSFEVEYAPRSMFARYVTVDDRLREPKLYVSGDVPDGLRRHLG